MALSSSLINCFPKYMHLRNLFAGEPGGFQGLQCPICSEASQPGNLSSCSLSQGRTFWKTCLWVINQNIQSKAMCIITLLPWVTIGMSEMEQAVAVGAAPRLMFQEERVSDTQGHVWVFDSSFLGEGKSPLLFLLAQILYSGMLPYLSLIKHLLDPQR